MSHSQKGTRNTKLRGLKEVRKNAGEGMKGKQATSKHQARIIGAPISSFTKTPGFDNERAS
jgi:hypothetical protein